MTRLRLIPRLPLFLTVFGDTDVTRFVRVFQVTWKRIPRLFRRRLLEHWKPSGPLIEVVPGLGHGISESELHLAQCGLMGHGIRFYSIAIDLLPDGPLSDVIVHELAHAFRFLHMKPPITPPYESDDVEVLGGLGIPAEIALTWSSEDREEVIAEKIVRWWGLVPSQRDEWLALDGNREKILVAYSRWQGAVRKRSRKLQERVTTGS